MTDRKFRILLLGDSRSFHIERLTVELRRQNCRVLTASFEHGTLHHFHLRSTVPLRPLSYLLAGRQIKVIAERFQPDIIYAHFATAYGYAAARVVKSLKVPIVLNLWGSDILMSGRPMSFRHHKARLALTRAEHVFADSQYLLEQARKLADVPGADVIPWGIEKDFLALHKKAYDFGKPLRIIVPRAHEPVYDNIFIVKALASLINSGKVRITFPEFGSVTKSFRLLSRPIVGDKIRYYARMPRRKFMELMALHDVYLSNSQSDSSPVSLIEAMALGLLPVAADIPGVREWLTPDSGLVYPVGNSAALLVTISGLINGNDCLNEIRRNNLERVKSEGLFEDNVARQVKVMRSVAEGAQS